MGSEAGVERRVPLSVLSQAEAPAPTRPLMLELPARGDAGAEPLPPPGDVGQKQTELAAKHDFAGKFRHPELLERLKAYVRAQASARQTVRAGETLDPDWLPAAAPISINLDITTACNYACDHCVDKEILNQPIKYDHQRLLDSLRVMTERGLKSVIVIGGGEPTVYPKFGETVRYMKSLDLRVSVVSNGSGQKKIEEIADCLDKEDWVRLSLDSATDETFTAMHKPKRPITLDEICQPVRRIKAINPRFQFGYSFIITWRGATINDTNIVENLHEIVGAAERAKHFGFDYISFKPFLTRAPENNAEIVGLDDAETERFEQVMDTIRRNIDQAKRFQGDSFKVLESTNLRVLENRSHRQFMHQPRECHMQFFRQILSPLGLYNCPVYRNQPHGKIHDKDAYATEASLRETLRNTGTLIREFDATRQCRQVTCLYNHANWWIEDLIQHPEKLDAIQPDFEREPDFFF